MCDAAPGVNYTQQIRYQIIDDDERMDVQEARVDVGVRGESDRKNVYLLQQQQQMQQDAARRPPATQQMQQDAARRPPATQQTAQLQQPPPIDAQMGESW